MPLMRIAHHIPLRWRPSSSSCFRWEGGTTKIFNRRTFSIGGECTTLSVKNDEKEANTSPSLPLRAPLPKRSILRRKMNVKLATEVLPQKIALAACLAKSFDFTRLSNFFASVFPHVKKLQEDVILITTVAKAEEPKKIQVFFFADGCFVIWGGPTEAASLLARLSELVKPFAVELLKDIESETLFYQENLEAQRVFVGMHGETIIFDLPSDTTDDYGIEQCKLAFSTGLADSVKLGALEMALEEFIERVKPIPSALASGSKIPFGRAQVLRLTGELLKFRADLNLHGELVETPEIFWSEPKLEDLYNRSARALDIRNRAFILNKRLDYANELASVLRSHLSESHGLKLEWGIIALIAVEVVFETLHWIRDIKSNVN